MIGTAGRKREGGAIMRLIAMFVCAATLIACTTQPPNPDEAQAMQSALKPSSPEAAQKAVKAYFDKTLIDPTAPLYRFPRPPVLGAVGGKGLPGLSVNPRRVGWFMCGEINSKNRMGGYTGFQQFFVHFSPTAPDTVDFGQAEPNDSEMKLVSSWCEDAYKQPS
jgi:hypothetical protein